MISRLLVLVLALLVFATPGTAQQGTVNARCLVNTVAPTYGDSTYQFLSCDTAGALRTSAAAAAGGTSSTFGAAFPATGTASGFSDGTNMQGGRVFDVDSGGGTQYVIGVNLRLTGAGGSVEAGTATNPIRTDPTGTTTQSISATALPLPTGAATDRTTAAGPFSFRLSDGAAFYDATKTGQLPAALVGARLDINNGAWLGSTAPTVGQKTMAASLPMAIASDQSAVPVSGTVTTTPPSNASTNVAQFGGTNVSTGAGAGGAGIPRVTVSSDSSLAANQSVNVNQFGGSAVVTGTGGSGAGVPRVTASTEDVTAGPTAFNANFALVAISVLGKRGVGMHVDAGTFAGTITPQVSMDGGTTYSNTYFIDPAGIGLAGNLVLTNPNAATERGILFRGGTTHVRVAVSPYTSGSANVTLRATDNASDEPVLPVWAAGVAVGSSALTLGGVDISSLPQQIQVRTDNDTNPTVKLATVPARANASAPAWTEGRVVPFSADLVGNTRVKQPQYTRSDTYTATGNGTTIDATVASPKAYGIQCTATGAVTSWDARLEGSLDNTTFTQILAHTNVTGTGVTVWSAANLSPSLYIRSRAAGLVLGAGTNIVCVILGTS